MITKLLLAGAVLVSTVSTQAQGFIEFNTRSVGARVFYADGITPVSGDAFLAQLFIAPGARASADSLSPIGVPVGFGTTSEASGYVNTAPPVVAILDTGMAPGVITVQMRVWSSNYATWSAAKAAYNQGDYTAMIGLSNLIDYTTTSLPSPPPNLLGLTVFTVPILVPEPCTMTLSLIGLAALTFRRRK